MRADRLISILMMLRRNGRVTVDQVAAELEISPRTARRDLEALSLSGVPIYSKHGRGGGWFLLGGASTDLTGLSAGEAQALFLAAGPATQDNPHLRQALRKLLTALPEPLRDDAEAAYSAVKIDPQGWGRLNAVTEPLFLAPLTSAVISGRQVDLDYQRPEQVPRVRRVHPLGLVTKRGIWYLVAGTDQGVRTYRLSRVKGLEVLDEPVERPPNFNLDRAWEAIVSDVESRSMTVAIRAVADPGIMRPLRYIFGDNLRVDGEEPDGRVVVSISDYTERSFSAQVAGFGSALRLLDPPQAVVEELRRIAGELSLIYGGA